MISLFGTFETLKIFDAVLTSTAADESSYQTQAYQQHGKTDDKFALEKVLLFL